MHRAGNTAIIILLIVAGVGGYILTQNPEIVDDLNIDTSFLNDIGGGGNDFCGTAEQHMSNERGIAVETCHCSASASGDEREGIISRFEPQGAFIEATNGEAYIVMGDTAYINQTYVDENDIENVRQEAYILHGNWAPDNSSVTQVRNTFRPGRIEIQGLDVPNKNLSQNDVQSVCGIMDTAVAQRAQAR